jgi:hypothetical protein
MHIKSILQNSTAVFFLKNSKALFEIISKNSKVVFRGTCACMCKEKPVIPVDKAVGKKRIIGINRRPRRRGTRGH